MAALILPSRRIVQPQYGAALDGAFAPQWVFVPGAKGRDQASGKAVTYKGNEAYSGFGSARFVDLDAGETIYSSEAVSPGNSFILVIQYRNTAALNDCFLVSAKANWDNFYGFYVSVKGANSLEISPGGQTFPTASIAGVGVGDGAVKTLVFHFRDTSLRIYHKGRLAADITMGLGAGAWSTGLALNGYTNAGSSSGSQAISYSLVAVLRNGDPESLSLNPWQIFRPAQRRIHFGAGAGGGGVTTHTVTAEPVEHGGTTTRPSLAQKHIITARSTTQGATVSRPGVSQTHFASARPTKQSAAVNQPLITQTHVVTARAVAQGSTVNAPSADQGSITVVTARPVAQSSTVNAPSIVQTHIVTARPAAQGGTVTRPGLTQAHTVTARAVTQGSVVNAPSVDVGSTPATVVTARPVAQGSTVNAPGIRQTHVTSARAVAQGSTINAPGLVQSHVVTARPVVQASLVRVAGIAPPFVRSIYWAAVPSEKFSAAVPAERFKAAVPSEKFRAAAPGESQ